MNALWEQLRARWRGAAAELALQVPVTRATQLYEQLLAEDPLDLETHVAYLNDLKRRAEPGRLRAALDAATATFQRELSEAPPELRDWGRLLVRAPQGQQRRRTRGILDTSVTLKTRREFTVRPTRLDAKKSGNFWVTSTRRPEVPLC